MLTPSYGFCCTPLTNTGWGRPAASSTVGATSITWWNCCASRPLACDAVGPVDDGAVARAAPVRGDLLGPLVGRVHGVRPAHGIVVVGIRRAELVDVLYQELGRHQVRNPEAVEGQHLVERALERAFGTGAVVADDVVDQGVVEDLQVRQRIDQPPDVVVGVLEESGVDLHLARQDRFHLGGHLVPGRDLGVAYWSAPPRAGSRPAASGGRRSLPAACPSPGRTCPCTSPTTPSARGVARASPPAQSR